jgi:hypothetical protein
MLTKAGPDHILFIYAQYTPVDEPFNKKSQKKGIFGFFALTMGLH